MLTTSQRDIIIAAWRNIRKELVCDEGSNYTCLSMFTKIARSCLAEFEQLFMSTHEH